MLTTVIQQAIILLAMGWVLSLNVRKGWRYPRLLVVTSGFWFGLATIVCMLLPLTVAPGVLLDARNGVMFVAGLFAGPVSGALAALLAGGFRFWLGGDGALTGTINIWLSLLLGLGFRHCVRQGWLQVRISHLLPVVLLLHVSTLGIIAFLMSPENRLLLPLHLWPFLAVMVPLTLMLALILHDAEQRQREQEALKESESRLRAITGALPDLMFVMDEDGRYLEVMASHPSLLYPVNDTVIGKRVDELFEPEQAGIFLNFIHETLERTDTHRLVYELNTFEGQRIFESQAQAMDAPLGQKRAVVILTRDITRRVRNETELRIAAVAFESFEGMLVTDAHNRILRVNRAFTEITGYTAEEVIGYTPALFSSGQHGPEFYREMWLCINAQGHWQGEICNKRKSGQVYPQWLSISAVRDEQGQVSHYVASITDITQRKKDAERINHLAFYDAVTGLPNRRLLNERIQQHQLDRLGTGLIFIDLDNFKDINDLWGLGVGDQLLQQAAQRLNKSLREQDIVARLGGDEFVVLLTGLPRDRNRAAALLEQTGHRLLSLLEQPYVHENHILRCSASMGVVLLENNELSPDELVQQAELAMYDAKNGGKGKLRFFDPRMQEVVAQRLRLEEDILRGLEAEEFKAHFQPQFDYQGNMVGAEALVRWYHPERGVLAPGAFIGVADEAGLMNRIDRMVLAQSCRQMAAWSRLPAFSDFSLSVNISAARLYQPEFIEDVLVIFEQTGVDPAAIKLEITESMLLDDMPTAIARMQTLKAHGVRFAIDDFGTGYSSLLYLQQLPLDQLKIDQSFVRALPGDENSLSIIQAIVAMAQSLKLEVIAEGVETEAQRQLLHQHGCQHYQGYLLSRPEPADVVQAMLDQRRCS
ncbi:EAL domain-containing protein [Oceanimonas sp. CHS3-5]|uniref:EAL domain-containing protein n=1 Tax=Oceanimonas sp. CHS3-5 TaxID=3068186 RepID=UPI00273F8138|nr:EAL domain-containing protein [Oceanimonas sp. CHS3-5]MDP5290809.1 EAL domain-containing protein [Oceanimonas sp. CHS3-5]